MKSETIVFNGLKFRRYPDSKRNHLRDYFWTSEIKRLGRSLSLHQEIWKFHNGEIPNGFEIHHKDRNPLNNDISNLECLSTLEHKAKHSGYCSERKRKHLDNVRHLANAWHKTKECSDFAKHNWKSSLGKLFVPKTIKCEICLTEFSTLASHGKTRFCSAKCKMQASRNRGANLILKNCCICGGEFKTSKYNPGSTCSFACRGKFMSQNLRRGTG